MSRTYANFLLFEDALDSLPNTSPVITQAVQMLLNPMTQIVMEDCNTLLGRVVDTSLELLGIMEVATNQPFTYTRIYQLLSQGKYKVGVRKLSACLAHLEGGVCQKCYESQILGTTAPVVGTRLSIPSKLIYQTDVLIGDGSRTDFELTADPDDFDTISVINQGSLISSSLYSISNNRILFNTPPSATPELGIHAVHFIKQDTEPFLGYVAKTYSGALLGMQPLPTLPPLLRQSLYETMFSDNFVELIFDEVSKFKAIPTTYKDYLERVHGKMEKLLLALYLYAIYSNVII